MIGLLTAGKVAHYLIERGLVSFDSVVDGDFAVIETPRRNRNFKVLRKNGPSYFLKQVLTRDSQAILTLQREAACYWLARSSAPFIALADIMPAFVTYDRPRHTLILELVPNAETISERYRRQGMLSAETAGTLGGLIGRMQRSVPPPAVDSGHTGIFPRVTPWILSIHQQRPEYFNPLSAGNRKLLETIARYPELHQKLDELRGEWRIDGFIHGDMKLENFIVSGSGRMPDIKLVDWEMADAGDRCWDVGAMLQAWLVLWALSIPVPTGGQPASFIDQARYPLPLVQSSLRAFWNAYVDERGFDAAESRAELLRCIRYGGARMIQSAYECLYYAPEMTPQAAMLLQMSSNILSAPADASRDLAGLS